MKKRKYQLIKGALVTAMSISTVSGFAFNTSNVYAVEKEESYYQIIYIIFDYPYKHYTFNHFKV